MPLFIRLIGPMLLASGLYLTGAAQPSKSAPGAGVEVRNLTGVNSERLDFSPAFYQNGLVYVSSRQHSGPKDKKIAESFFELFFVELDERGNFLRAEPFSVNINSQKHEGPVSFNRTGDVLYFTRNNMENGAGKGNEAGVSHLKIYEARKGVYDWSNPVPLPFSSDDYTVAHPSLSADGQSLYFTSDMPGGRGGMDLYVAHRTPDGWGTPQNLGKRVNTTGNDLFPFVHRSGHLVFASNGHGGAGGLDLFYWNTADSTAAPVRLPAPFNSPADDLSLILDDSGRYGYFASSRAGGLGQDDLYAFSSPTDIFGTPEVAPVSLALTLTGAADRPLADVEVRVFELADNGLLRGNDLYTAELQRNADGVTSSLQLRRKEAENLGPAPHRSDTTGRVSLALVPRGRYLLMASRPGYQTHEQRLDFEGDSVPMALVLQLDSLQCRSVSGVLSDRTDRRPLAGHVLTLITADGNRSSLRTDTTGTFTTCLDPTDWVTLSAELPGYVRSELVFSPAALPPNGLQLALQPAAMPADSGPAAKPTPVLAGQALAEGSVLVLENIYYEFDKSAIRTGAAEELDALLALLRQYPSMHIDLLAHTDARGTATYNKALSQRRADSAKAYLVGRGISPNRIAARGMGESRLRNACTTNAGCTEAEHAYNRRTEVRITRLAREVEDLGDE